MGNREQGIGDSKKGFRGLLDRPLSPVPRLLALPFLTIGVETPVEPPTPIDMPGPDYSWLWLIAALIVWTLVVTAIALLVRWVALKFLQKPENPLKKTPQ